MAKPVILTGIRSNSEPTLGNYLGAIQPMVTLAKEKAGDFRINMFVPDLHSFTTPIDYSQLYANSLHNVRLFAAAGLPLDHPDIYVYRQSYIPAHSELAWILSCFTGFGEAARMVEFKDKAGRLGEDHVTAGLYNYPILMAADILLYGAEWIPVGEDQRQHIELARDLAIRLNNKFGDLFIVPQTFKQQQQFINRDTAARIRSLRNPEKKMSKSIEDPAGTILLSDRPDEAAKKIMSATTDSEGVIRLDYEKQLGVSNLLQIQALLLNEPVEATARKWEGKSNYGELKREVASLVESFLTGFQSRLAQVNDEQLRTKLSTDEAHMNEVANAQLLRIQKAVGLR